MKKKQGKKKQKPTKFGQIGRHSQQALLALLDGGETLVDMFRRPHLHLLYGSDLPEIDAYWERVEQERSVKRLKKKKWLEEKKQGNRIVLQLTDSGKVFALGQRIVNTERKLSHGRACLVSFDIPERARAARLTLRRLFKSAEFNCCHHSAWITDKDVVDDLTELIRLLGIKDWVSVFRVDKKV